MSLIGLLFHIRPPILENSERNMRGSKVREKLSCVCPWAVKCRITVLVPQGCYYERMYQHTRSADNGIRDSASTRQEPAIVTVDAHEGPWLSGGQNRGQADL